MPSFLGHFVGLSFRTELLIMNLLGLVNSTLDWSPLKWTNELERIWNLSLSQSALIIDVIGEDTIKTVLSWIVITRIVIAHVYTLTYVTNIYPIITWSQPKLLLPWLILSFFKNVVLEVIVIVIGLLLWYDSRFSIFIFLEFIFVKLVPLLLAAYNWYTNSCLFLQLRHLEKMRKLKRPMRSDTNLLTTRLYAKLEDSKYRTRSLTTLLTCESFESYDTQDTISHIIDDPALSPVEKTMKLLGLSEHDIEEARIRVRQRAKHRRLTELDDESLVRLFNMNNKYQLPSTDAEVGKRNIDLDKVDSTNEYPGEPELLFPLAENPEIEVPEVANPFEAPEAETSGRSENEVLAEAKATSEPPLSRRKREGTGTLNTSRTKQMKMYSCYAKDLKTCTPYQKRKESSRPSSARQTRRSVEESYSPAKLQALFDCNCTGTDRIACCEVKDATLRTSTPKKNVDIPGGAGNPEDNSMDRSKVFDQSYVYTCSVTNVKTDFVVSSSYPEISTLLQKNLEIFQNIKVDDLENLLAKEMAVQRVKQIEDDPKLLEPYFDHRNAVIDVQDLSEIAKDLSATNLETSRTAEPEVKADDDGVKDRDVDTTQKTTNKDVSKLNLPEHSFGDTNIPRFYKDSMMVFDGCYEKDFANNSEVQSLLRQLEKKKWNVFDDHTNLETLHRGSYSKQDIDPRLQDLGTIHLLNDRSEKLDRYRATEPISLRATSKVDPLISGEAQAEDQPVIYPLLESKKVPSSDSVDSTKTSNVHTQTDEELQPSSSRSSLSEGKKRKRAYFKRKRLSEQSRSTSPCSVKLRAKKTDTRFTVSNNRPKSPVAFARHKMAKPVSEDARKKNDPTKSPSNNSVCECPMSKLEAKHGDTRKRDENRKSSTKPKVDTFGTLPLAQVVRQSEIETMVYRRKPPVYPKKFKKETRDVVAPSKMPSGKKTEPVEYKRSTSKASNSSRTSKVKSAMDDPETREMRALKAYNEVTLLKDKEELEKKKLPSRRIAEDRVFKDWKSQPRAQKSKLLDDYTNKENLLIDTATEIDPSVASPSEVGKPTLNAGRSYSVSNERYRSARMAKINRVTDRLLDNFDRLHVTQARQESKKSKPAELDARKQYTKYSKPKKLVVEENLSASSSKRLEGTQKGRDLERTLAKEDVRDETVHPIPVVESPKRVNVEFAIPEAQDTELLMLKPSANEDLASSCSSSTVDHREEIQTVLEESPNIENETAPPINEIEKQVIEDLEAVDVEEDVQSHPETHENEPQRLRTPNVSWNRTSPDLTDFFRNIDVSRLPHGVVLTNPIAQGKKSRQMDIIDDKTTRMVHNAFSYKSMDSLLDVPPDTVTVEDILHGSHLEPSIDEFVYRPSNEDVFVEELSVFPEHGSQLEQAIVATIRESQDANRDLCIITIGHDILPDRSATEDVEDDGSRGRVNEILSSITEVLGGFNITGLDIEAIANMEFELLRELLDAGEVGVPRNQVFWSKEITREAEYSREREQMLRIVEEDVCTNIKFPVVIKMSDLIPGVLDIGNSSSRVLVSRVDSVRMSFSRLAEALESREKKGEEEKEEKTEDEESLETGTEKGNDSLEAIMLSMMESMRQMNINDDRLREDPSDSEDSFGDFRSESDTLTHVSLNSKLDSTIEEFPVDTSQWRETRGGPSRGGLNETFEIKRVEESSEEDLEGTGETPGEEEGVSSGDSVRLGRIEESIEIDEAEASIVLSDLEGNIQVKEAEESETDLEETGETPRDEEDVSLRNKVGRIEESIENDEASIILGDLEGNIQVKEAEESETDLEETDEAPRDEEDVRNKLGRIEESIKINEAEATIIPSDLEENIQVKEAEESETDLEETDEAPRDEEDVRNKLGRIEESIKINEAEATIIPSDLEENIQVKEAEESETDLEETGETPRDEEDVSLRNKIERIEESIENDEASIVCEDLEENIEIKEAEDRIKPCDLEENILITVDENTIKVEEGEYRTEIEKSENKIKLQQSEGSIKPEVVEESIEIEEAEDSPKIRATGRDKEFLEDEDIEEGLAMIGFEDTVEDENEVVSGRDVADFKEELSLQILFSFWLMVFYFYTQYFCQKIYSLSRVSRATSMLKPFDVHAVSTSTSTLLEKAELVEKIRRESRLDLETSGFENVDTPAAIEEHLRSVLNLTIDKICSGTSSTEMEGILVELREEVEKTVLSMRDRVAEIMETVPSNRGIETREEVLPRDRDPQPRCLFPIEVQTSENYSSSVKESSAIATNTRLSIIELEEDDLIDTRSTKRGIPTSRVKEVDLVEGDRAGSSGRNQSYELIEDDREEDYDDDKSRVRDATDLSQSTMIIEERVEADKSAKIEESVSSTDLETTRKEDSVDLQPAEREIATFRFTEVDGSSSLESLIEDEVEPSEKYRLIEKIYNEGLGKEESMVKDAEEPVSPRRNVEEAEKSAESVEEAEKTGENVSNSNIHFETTLEEMDSFDSAYTAFSETTQNSVSFADFLSAMEEFSIASNLSDEDA